MRSEAQKKADKKFITKNIKKVTIDLNRNTDADIIAYLEKQDNKLGTIKKLIRAEIEKED